MPGILINEQEDLSLGQVSVVENVVLVPLFVDEYLKDDQGDEIKAKKYTLYQRFVSDVKYGKNDCILLKELAETNSSQSKPEKYDMIIDKEYYVIDKSYFYIKELIGMGLSVVVRFVGPRDYAEWQDSEGDFVIPETDGKWIDSFDKKLDYMLNQLINGTESNSETRYGGIYEDFKDRNLYNLKFITTGAHANLFVTDKDTSEVDAVDHENSCYDVLANVAARRGDAIALIEIEDDYDLDEKDSLLSNREQLMSDFAISTHDFEYAACFYPWGVYAMNFSKGKKYVMPASFGYLMAFAYSIQVNEDWFAASGVSRGFIPNLVSLNYQIGDSFMHVLQSDEPKWFDRDDAVALYDDIDEGQYLPIRINPIMFKGAYGNRVWGNRTFSYLGDDGITAATHSNVSFREYLNVRMLLCDIKKQIYGAATRVTFEPNDDITWLNFKGLVNNLLDRMQNGRGLEWYHWQKEVAEDEHGNRRKATIKATLTIKPIEAVEYFDITVYLTDEDAVVAEPVL